MRTLKYLSNNGQKLHQTSTRNPWSHWTIPSNRKNLIYAVEKTNGFKNLEEWYTVDPTSFGSDTSYIIRQFYDGSLYKCLSDVYPQYSWESWKFMRKNAPVHHWEDPNVQHTKMNTIAKELRVKSLDDWYDFGVNDITAYGGRCILRCHKNSLSKTLEALFPDFKWTPTNFQHAPKNYWTLPRQRQLFNTCAEQLGVKVMDDWYGIRQSFFKEVGGDYIIEMYGGSLQRALQSVYKNHVWDNTRFHWQGLTSTRAEFDQWTLFRTFLRAVRKKAGFTSPEMWYHVSFRQLTAFSNTVQCWRLSRFWPQMLVELEPNYNWEWEKFTWKGSASKPRFIIQALQIMFKMKEQAHV